MHDRSEVVVIGGGIIGCSTALALAEQGADVLLLETNQIAHGASGRNHGLVFYPQDLRTDPLYRESHAIYRRIAEDSDLRIGLDESPRGFIVVVTEESEWAAAEAEARACAEGGVEIRRLSAEELSTEEPNLSRELHGGWFIDDGFRLDPAVLTLAIALQARKEGAEIFTGSDVKQILVKDSKVTGVATDDGVVLTEKVVVAAGPWSSKLLRSAGVDIPLMGARGWLVLTRAVKSLTNHLIESSGWHLTAGDPGPTEVTVAGYASGEHPRTADIGLLIQQNATGHVLLGGSRLASMREDPEGHEVTLKICQMASKVLPALSDIPLSAVWSGVRPMTPDGLPVIGPMTDVEGLYVASGHGGQGVILGAGSGRLAAELVLGGQPFSDPSPFRPARFDPARR